MNTIIVKREIVENDYPSIYNEFIESLRTSSSLSRKMDIEKSKWFYSWGFFVPKAKNEEEKVLRDLQNVNRFNMEYSERLELELSKVRVTVTMEAGKFLRGDRVRKMLNIPQSIKEIVGETTKLQMIVEQKEVNNTNVMNSIPPFDFNIIPKEQVEMVLGPDFEQDSEEEVVLDIDSILDKISSDGIESLSEEEKEYLDSQK